MILLLDTSTPEVSLTLVDEGVQQARLFWQADRQLAHGLLGWLHDALEQHNKDWQDLSAIGVYHGPGSFTGLRIGIAVCNTLADSLDIPIVSAGGDDWQRSVLERLERHESEGIVMPEYGRDARITTPRK